jgi:predicted transcriptional regulator
MNKFKANNHTDRSDSIVVSFHNRWLKGLSEKSISIFFRKRAPVQSTPSFVFLYIGSPAKKMIGYAKILRIERLPPDEALKHCASGGISESDLLSYLEDAHVFAYFIGEPIIFEGSLPLEILKDCGNFHPPQSFFFTSIWGVEQLKILGGKK